VNTRFLTRGVATLALTAGLGVSGSVVVNAAGVAAASPSAAPSPTPGTLSLAALKARCNVAVQRRLGTLGADATFVKQSTALSSADRATLEAQIGADQQGLSALDQTIQADTSFAQAHADCERIVTGYRVYVLEDPKIHEVIAADGVSKVDGALQTLTPELQSLINNSTVSAADKAAAQRSLNDLIGKVSASETSISGVTSLVINLTPAGWPGNQVDLQSARKNITTARTDLDGARADVNNVLRLLSA
jgi:hypothetical protein